MKKALLKLVFIFLVISTINAQEKTHNLTVNITGLSSDKGKIMIGIYNKKEHFLKDRFKDAVVAIKNKKAVIVFNDLPKGEYAVSLVHDENDNKKMDTNLLGIPKEDYGCSNNARGFMGPPKYEDAKFMLESDKIISIAVN